MLKLIVAMFTKLENISISFLILWFLLLQSSFQNSLPDEDDVGDDEYPTMPEEFVPEDNDRSEMTTLISTDDEYPTMREEFGSEDNDRSEMTTLISTVDARELPLDLYDIGYMGTWERFCDPEEIEKEFRLYPHYHELMRVRNTICDCRMKNLINREAIPAFAVYKYCQSMRTRVDAFLGGLIAKFSNGEEGKTKELLDKGPLTDFTPCYEDAIRDFKQKCIGKENPYFDMFKHLLGRVCIMEWITTFEIRDHISKVCDGKYITDEIDWRTIVDSIKYRDGKSTAFGRETFTRPTVDLNQLH